ncbi:ribosomal protein L18e/L15P [Protomyces lactucae-debilis]|uniref:Ribosomal protein L18e/L15P n=1 Tax=Protomyces lactucae-debilis TaxID=2754530 RepID=A0A1Y2EQ23_PROLT|nr:ribosomal protein L18e/L15P [Protomyces lactucae-debilis]ORY73691.1 ribosomal protein L18e/L15P [Protomyces lactucae-debilis]
MSILNRLSDNEGATHNVKRLGRGPGSGKGKTAGRGHKGQKARSGNGAPRGFEGGQTPISRLFPKRGFNNSGEEDLSPLNLGKLQLWIDLGRINPSKPISMKDLVESNVIHGIKDGVKLLAGGKEALKTPVQLDVTKASAEAIARIEAVGGSIVCTYRNALSMRALLKPHTFAKLPKPALPTRRKDLEFYTMKEKRGYLADDLASGKIVLPANPAEAARKAASKAPAAVA